MWSSHKLPTYKVQIIAPPFLPPYRSGSVCHRTQLCCQRGVQGPLRIVRVREAVMTATVAAAVDVFGTLARLETTVVGAAPRVLGWSVTRKQEKG